MSTAIAQTDVKPLDTATVSNVIIKGDLSGLSDGQLLAYNSTVCEKLGLDPMTQPFAFIKLNGKLVMYAKKDATEQLRKLHGVSITAISSTRVDDVFVVTATALDRSGRTDCSTGAVALGTLKGEALANALMKAETKAKRRVTLSICGLGMLDETEVESAQAAIAVLPKVEAVALADGAFQILNVVRTGDWSADVTYVDHNGVEDTLPMVVGKNEGGITVAEKFQQDLTPVLITRVIGARDKKRKIGKIERWKSPEDIENERLDAEIAAKEAIKQAEVL